MSVSSSLSTYLRDASELSKAPLHGLDEKTMVQLAKGTKQQKQIHDRLQQLQVWRA